MNKPKQITETKTYWSCGGCSKRHPSEAMAIQCIARMQQRSEKASAAGQRRQKVVELFSAGKKKSHIAKELGISATRVAEILVQRKRREKRTGFDPLEGLTYRAANALRRTGAFSLAEVRRVAAMSDRELQCIPNIGPITIREIREWVSSKEGVE